MKPSEKVESVEKFLCP